MYYAIYNKLHADLTTYINYILIVMYTYSNYILIVTTYL